jgi:hypothetical protein
MNERKQVRIYDLIDIAKQKVLSNVDINKVESDNNYKLVHAQGKTFTLENIIDERFSIGMG